jgi:hypothetical protein
MANNVTICKINIAIKAYKIDFASIKELKTKHKSKRNSDPSQIIWKAI